MKQKIKLVGTEEYLKFRSLKYNIEEADRKSAELWKRKLALRREIEDIDEQIKYHQSMSNDMPTFTNALNSNKFWTNDEQSGVIEIVNIECDYDIAYKQYDEEGEHKYFSSSKGILLHFPNPINEETFRKIKNTWQK